MNNFSTIKKVIKYIRKYIPLLLISIFLSAGTVILTLYLPMLTGRAIDGIIEAGRVDFDLMKDILSKAALVIALTAAFQWIANVCNNKMTYMIVRDIRNDAFGKIKRLPVSYIDSHPHGDIVSRIIADVDAFADGLLMGFTQLFAGVMTIFCTLIFMLSINVKIALVVIVLTPLSLFVAAFIAKKTFSMFLLSSKTKGEQTALIQEMIGNQKVVEAFSYEDDALRRFDEINERLSKASLRSTFFSSITNPSTRFVNNIVYALVCVVGAVTVLSGGAFTVGNLSCFLTYANQYTKPFNEISGVVTELQNALACAARIFEFMEAEEETDSVESAAVNEINNCRENSVDKFVLEGRIELSDVDFSYDKKKPLIENFNLSVEKGQKIAIVGPTGCGKTTFINLIMRFYDIDAGSITIDGIDTAKMPRAQLRQNFGMVLQETWLKRGTVLENIKLAKPDATMEEVIEAAKKSNAHSFIKRLKNGYDTVLGEDGGMLSTGQKQLLCITRVMLALPPMLILDEATSSIDTRTEIKIQDAFYKMMEGRTSFIVAHRLSTIRNADIILVMKDGSIIEQGSHEELIDKHGFYYDLYNSQFA